MGDSPKVTYQRKGDPSGFSSKLILLGGSPLQLEQTFKAEIVGFYRVPTPMPIVQSGLSRFRVLG